jgi:hypothetical protein
MADPVSATRLGSGFLYISPTDPLTFVAVAVLLVMVMLAGSDVPARQATNVTVLRSGISQAFAGWPCSGSSVGVLANAVAVQLTTRP